MTFGMPSAAANSMLPRARLTIASWFSLRLNPSGIVVPPPIMVGTRPNFL